MTPTPDPLREALNAVVTKTTWRPDNTVLIHDGTAWNTLVGRIVMATNGDVQPAPALDVEAAALFVLRDWFECQCDEAWTGRELHASYCYADEVDEIAEAIALRSAGKS